MNNELTDKGTQNEHNGYKIRIDEQIFNLHKQEVTGRELLTKVGRDPERFLLTLVLPGEPDRLISLDEYVDLTAPGIEQFALVSKEIHYSFRIDERPFSITDPTPTGRYLLGLVGRAPETHLLNLNLPNQDDLLIEANEQVDLRMAGREQFSVTVKDHPHPHITIIVNGRKKVVTAKVLSFEQIVALAFETMPSGQNIVFTVVYRGGEGNKPDGTLSSGDTIKVKDGMIFNVTATDKS
jgi:hypothetical protein